jgi:hypothetical protein
MHEIEIASLAGLNRARSAKHNDVDETPAAWGVSDQKAGVRDGAPAHHHPYVLDEPVETSLNAS